jgi:hypothetical protein
MMGPKREFHETSNLNREGEGVRSTVAADRIRPSYLADIVYRCEALSTYRGQLYLPHSTMAVIYALARVWFAGLFPLASQQPSRLLSEYQKNHVGLIRTKAHGR